MENLKVIKNWWGFIARKTRKTKKPEARAKQQWQAYALGIIKHYLYLAHEWLYIYKRKTNFRFTINICNIFNFRDPIKANAIWAFGIIKKPEFYKPFRFLIIILGLLELSGFAVLANYSIVLVKVRIISKYLRFWSKIVLLALAKIFIGSHFQKYGFGSNKTFVDAGTLITIISLIRIPISFLAMPVLQKFRKRPLYLTICIFMLLTIAGLITFTHLIEIDYITQEDIKNSIGCVHDLL